MKIQYSKGMQLDPLEIEVPVGTTVDILKTEYPSWGWGSLDFRLVRNGDQILFSQDTILEERDHFIDFSDTKVTACPHDLIPCPQCSQKDLEHNHEIHTDTDVDVVVQDWNETPELVCLSCGYKIFDAQWSKMIEKWIEESNAKETD